MIPRLSTTRPLLTNPNFLPGKARQPGAASVAARSPARVPLRPIVSDTVCFGCFGKTGQAQYSRYKPQVPLGAYGLPPGHMYHDTFKVGPNTWNPPGVARIVSVKSLDPDTANPAKAYACEIMVDLSGTKLAGNTTPGEHLSLLDISDANTFTPEFMQALRQQGNRYQFSPQDLEKLGHARLKNFTIASPRGGERNAPTRLKRALWQTAQQLEAALLPATVAPLPPVRGERNGQVRLIVRRVEYNGVKGPMTNYLANLKPGDPLVFAAPISHHFLGPKASTPAIFFGVGSSVSPYSGMLQTRFEHERGPYADTYLAIGHTRPALEYDRAFFQQAASQPNNHFTYRPVYSREPEKSNGAPYVQSLIQNREEARKIFALLLNPQAQIYISGFQYFDQQLFAALKKSARTNNELGVSEARIDEALEKAIAEDRLHVEGEIRQDLQEGLQGY